MENNDKIHDPLFQELFKIALPQMEGYQADLGHDTLRLATAVPGERYLWGVRKHGTEMRIMPDNPEARSRVMRETIKTLDDHRWYLLEVTAVRQDGYCAGTVTPLPQPAEAAAPRDPMHACTQDNNQ
jgi:hypothetical protein